MCCTHNFFLTADADQRQSTNFSARRESRNYIIETINSQYVNIKMYQHNTMLSQISEFCKTSFTAKSNYNITVENGLCSTQGVASKFHIFSSGDFAIVFKFVQRDITFRMSILVKIAYKGQPYKKFIQEICTRHLRYFF